MVDDHVPQRSHRVVEVTSVLDAEVLGHRDLDARDVVAAPDRLEHRVRKAQVEDLLEPHLPEVVVDPVELRLVDRLVQLGGERMRRFLVVAERLLDDDARGLRQPRVGEALDDPPEQERRDLEIEDRQLCALDRGADAVVRRSVAEVSLHVREPGSQTVEHRGVERLARSLDRLARALAQLVDVPVVDGDADDRAIEQAATLEPVQRPERHHLREIAGDPEDHEHVCCRSLCH